MPELPEVETVRRGLSPVLTGKRLARVEQRRADLRFPFPDGFVQRLTGATIRSVDRRAKYLLMPLDRGDTLVCHLGMSGRFDIDHHRIGVFAEAVGDDPKHEHVVFVTEDGVRVAFFDPRRFGYMDLVPTDRLPAHPWFAALGPEPLSDAFDGDVLLAAIKGKTSSTVKSPRSI